ncbi:unnamed protein product [Calicophoron daubneyi]|uniref:C2 domain-containing protein n=1 Tax=Calicophoron daubneyi TaxID=300641 RepID=A0AAV2TCF3_CALDB
MGNRESSDELEEITEKGGVHNDLGRVQSQGSESSKMRREKKKDRDEDEDEDEETDDIEALKRALASKVNMETLTYNDIYCEGSDDDQWYEEEVGSMGISDIPETSASVADQGVFTPYLNLIVSYSTKDGALVVRLSGTNGVPGKRNRGADAYQVTMDLLPDDEQHFQSALRIGPNPPFNDTWSVPISLVPLQRSQIRVRLFGCLHARRDMLYGEDTIPLSKLNHRVENRFTAELIPRAIPAAMVEFQDMEQKRIKDAPLAREVPEDGICGELFVIVGYSHPTGKMELCVKKGSEINGGKDGQPTTFVTVTLETGNNVVIGQARTKVIKKSDSPDYEEEFVFNVKKTQLETIAITFTLFRKSGSKKLPVGSFTMGSTNTSNMETQHWDEVMSEDGQRVARWHKLFTPEARQILKLRD